MPDPLYFSSDFTSLSKNRFLEQLSINFTGAQNIAVTTDTVIASYEPYFC